VVLAAAIGLTMPAGQSGPWSRRTGAPKASATRRDRTLRARALTRQRPGVPYEPSLPHLKLPSAEGLREAAEGGRAQVENQDQVLRLVRQVIPCQEFRTES
jgi:hypothetical protein